MSRELDHDAGHVAARTTVARGAASSGARQKLARNSSTADFEAVEPDETGADASRPSVRKPTIKSGAETQEPQHFPIFKGSRARPRGFEPLTFGSVDRRGSAKFGCSKPNSVAQVAK
jgi:hypothetical protein